MSRYILTAAARDDLDAIAFHIARKSIDNAIAVANELERAIRMLASRPGIGHRRDDLVDESLRVWPVYSYLIVYRSETRPIEVLRVLHGARDIGNVIEEHL